MSYIIPAPLIYQQLANSGGAANTSPDLDAVIIGPCYNVVNYDSSSSASLTLSTAVDADGNATSLTDNSGNTVVYLPSTKVGQVLDESSLAVYLSEAVVETLVTGIEGSAGDNELTIPAYAASNAASTTSSSVITGVTNPGDFVTGDNVTITEYGSGGATVTANILEINGSSFTLDVAAGSTSAACSVTRSAVNNRNTVSATLRVEGGDTAIITYTTSGAVTKTFESTVSEVVSTNDVITSVLLSDILPADVVAGLVKISFRKTYHNQLLANTEYNSDTTAADGKVTILPTPHLTYGLVVTATVNIAYRALRTDLSGSIQTITTTGDVAGILGEATERNPLGLGVTLALANTTTQVLAVAVPSDDLTGYLTALELIEDARVYSLVALTQSIDILTAVQQHAQQLSTPQQAHWRIALNSVAIPTTKHIGMYTEDLVNANGGNNAITNVGGKFILTASNATFMSDGVVPGDIVRITAGTGSTSPIGAHQVKRVLSNQQVELVASSTATGISYYVSRNLTKAQQAEYVASVSTAYGSSRVVNCPNTAGVTINGVTKYLPGYYFMCGIAGLIAGLPAQAGLTNIALAGFVDVTYSNFYFTRAQMDVMASAGTLLIVQETQGSIPYIRHELTTDMSVLQYREIQQVKNWDYLSYAFYDVIKPFIGKWNITTDSLQTVRQSIMSKGRLLQGAKLPKIGAPLVDFSIKTLAQDTVNTDNVIIEMPIKMATPMNYVSLYLIV